MNRIQNGLPNGWVSTTLGEVTQPCRRKENPKSYPKLQFIGMEHIEAHSMRLLATVPANTMKSNAVHFFPDDVLYGRLRPYLNKVFRPDFEGLCSSEFIVFPASTNLNSKFLQYFLNSIDFVSFASQLNEGDRPRVDFSQIVSYEFRLPPFAEQARIVAKIEEILTQLETGVEELRKAQAQLKRYSLAVLKAAVTGELTRAWREAQKVYVVPVSKLLERVLNERHENWQAQQLEKMRAQGKHPKNDSWKKKYRAPASPNIAGVEDLPQTWTWTNLEQLSAFDQNALKAGPFGSSLKKSFYVASGYKIYGQEQVLSGNANYGDYYIDELLYRRLKSCAVKPRDLLMSMVGTIGKILILPDDIQPGIINPRLVKISLHEELVDPRYIKIFLSSPGVQSRFSLASHGGTMDILNLTILKGIPVALPPVSEQSAIIDEVERVLSIKESVENAIYDTLRRMNSMRQTVLKCAFEGKLVPQDPNDEPAELLLERIKLDRAKGEAEKQAEAKSNRKRFTKDRTKRTERPAA